MAASAPDSPGRRLQLHLRRRELRLGGELRHLPPKAFAVLELLVERAGEVVTRIDLVEHAWGGMAVSADAVRYAIRQVRIAMDDPVDAPDFVETVARRGWRFVGRVARVDAEQCWLVPARAATRAKREERPVLVGRAAERSALDEALREVSGGQARTVFVIGEPGIGKTALIEAFVGAAADCEDALIARGECIEYHGAGQPFMPMLEAVERAAIGLGGGRPAAILRRHAPTWLAQLPSLSDPEDRQAILDETEGASHARTIRELQRAFEVFAEQRPLIVWIEDLHWADQSTLDAVASLAEKLVDSAVMLIVTMRPAEGVLSGFADTLRELDRRRRCRVLVPGRLEGTSIVEYLAARFGRESSPARSDALRVALERAGSGNPLFLVSLVDELVERGTIGRSDHEGWLVDEEIDVETVPARLDALIERQLATLAPDARILLEVASVAGFAFNSIELGAALGASAEAVEEKCDRLMATDRFFHVQGAVAWPDGSIGTEYRFRHSLHRAALRSGLYPGTASRIHGALAECKEAAFEGQLDEVAAELAYHFERGLDLAQAITYLTRAGEVSARRSSNLEATEHLRRAISLLDALPEAERWPAETRARLAICAPLAAVAGYGAVELAENLARLEVLTADLGDTPAMFPVLLGLWSLSLVRGDLAASTALGTRLLRIAEGEEDPIVRLQAHRAVGHGMLYSGRLEEGEAHFDRALSGYDVEEHQRLDYSIGDDPVVLVHAYRGWSLWFHGQPERAVDNAEAALRHAERLGHPPSLAFALAYGSVLHQLRHDEVAAWEWSDRLLELAREEGMALWVALGQIVHGWAIAEASDLETGIEMLVRGLDGWEATGAELGRPYFVCILAALLGRVGRHDEASALMPQIHDCALRTGQTIFLAERHRVNGVLLARATADDEHRRAAIEHLDRAIELAHATATRGLELRAALSLVDALAGTPEEERALDALRRVNATFDEGSRDRDCVRARLLLEGPADSRTGDRRG